MARELYDESIVGQDNIDWGGSTDTDGKPVKGNRVQEYIKEAKLEKDFK